MQKVKFILDKKIDIQNHLNVMRNYKKRLKAGAQKRDKRIEAFLKLSQKEQRRRIDLEISGYYKNKTLLKSLLRDINSEWLKREEKFIKRLEKIHKHPFKFKGIRGVLSTGPMYGYSTKDKWFAAKMLSNKFIVLDAAMHELMHFMFHEYYWNECKKAGLAEEKIWAVKEALTVLLNVEFADMMFGFDKGYEPHKRMREAIAKAWAKDPDFDKVLKVAIYAA